MIENQQNEVQLRSVLSVIFKRKNQILAFFSVTVITAVVATFLITPQYEASSQILVTLGPGGLLFGNVGDKQPQVSLDQENIINSEIEILKSASIAGKVIKEMGGGAAIFPEIAESAIFSVSENKTQIPGETSQAELKEALLKFQQTLVLTPVKKSNLINVWFRHPDARLSAEILNRLTSIYVDHHSTIRKTKKSYEFFQNQTELLKDKAIGSDKELESFKRQHEISDFDEQKNILIRQHTELQFALNQTVTAEMEANNRSDELRKNMQSLPQNIPQGKQDD